MAHPGVIARDLRVEARAHQVALTHGDDLLLNDVGGGGEHLDVITDAGDGGRADEVGVGAGLGGGEQGQG